MDLGRELPEIPGAMLYVDPPEHVRYRRLVNPGFSTGRIRALEAEIRERARGLIDRIEPGVPHRPRRRGHGAVPAARDRRSPRCARRGLAALLHLVRPHDRGRDRADRRVDHGAHRDGDLLPRPRGRASRCAPGRPRVDALRGRGRRREAQRRRADDVLRAAARRRQRDDAQPPLRRHHRARRPPRAVAAPPGRAGTHPGRRRRAPALDHAGDQLHAHGHASGRAARPRDPRGRPAAAALHVREPDEDGVRRHGRPARRDPTIRTTTCRSGSASTSVSARHSRGSRRACSSRSCSRGSPTWSPPGRSRASRPASSPASPAHP